MNMENLVLFGEIFYEEKYYKFSFENNIIVLHDRIPEIGSWTNSIGQLSSYPILTGNAFTGQSIAFLDCEWRMTHFKQELIPAIVIISNKLKLNNTTTFNSIKMTGGSLNNFGDLIQEIFISNTDHKEVSELRDGVCTFQSRPSSQTDFTFTDPSNCTEHIYSFSSNRQFLLNDNSIKKFDRSFFYKNEVSFGLHNILEQVVCMIDFLKILSWTRNQSIDRCTLGVIGELGQNNPKADVYFNLPMNSKSKYKISLLDYKDDNNSIGNLLKMNKSLEKSHVFLLNEELTTGMYDSKQILDVVITYEQILDHLKFTKLKMNPDLKKLRNEIVVKYSNDENFSLLADHLNNFKGLNLKDSVKAILDDEPGLVSELISKSRVLNNKHDLFSSICKVIDFRNMVVHSSKFDITTEGLADGAFLLTYINYYLILSKSGFKPERCFIILNKLFRLF